MDTIDYQIVEFLAKDSRLAYAQIAAQIGKSTATVHQRVRRMREHQLKKRSVFRHLSVSRAFL